MEIKLDNFIQGELVDLCIPTLEYAKESDWYSLFNNPKTTKFLEQGAFPNTREDEVTFFENERGKRLILIIVDKKGNDLGVISFSFINYVKRSADLAIVISDKEHHPLAGLESMARMLEHGFIVMGLERIYIGQHIKLIGWQKMCELVGFKAEGILEKGFVKGRERSDSITSVALVDDFDIIIKNRDGHLWDSSDKMMKRIAKMPKRQFVKELEDFFSTVKRNYYNTVFNL